MIGKILKTPTASLYITRLRVIHVSQKRDFKGQRFIGSPFKPSNRRGNFQEIFHVRINRPVYGSDYYNRFSEWYRDALKCSISASSRSKSFRNLFAFRSCRDHGRCILHSSGCGPYMCNGHAESTNGAHRVDIPGGCS